MKRKTFNILDNTDNSLKKWIRVRDEGDKITLTYKEIVDNTINGVNELEITVDNFDIASELIGQTNFKESAYQENYREIWRNEEVEIVIDTWPCLQSYIEIEGKSSEIVNKYSRKLGFDLEKDAYFGGVDVLYKAKYGISLEEFRKLSMISFDNKDLEASIKAF